MLLFFGKLYDSNLDLQRMERERNKEEIRKMTEAMIEEDRRIAKERQEDARMEEEKRRMRMEKEEAERVCKFRFI